MNIIFPTTLTRLPMFNRLAISVINLAILGLLFTVYHNNKYKDKQSKIFGFMGIFMIFWVDFAYLARLIGLNNPVLSEIMLRVAWIATPPLFYATYLTSVFVVKKQNNYKFITYGLFALTFLLSVLTAFTNVIIEGIELSSGTLDIIYGVGFYPFLLSILTIMVFTIAPFYKTKLKKASKVFLLGVFSFYFANFVFNIVLPAFLGVTHLYYIGDYSTLLLLGMTAYAIIQHELFDVKVVATEALTVVIWITLFSKMLVSQSLSEAVIDGFVFFVVLVFGILLIRSVIKEIEQRKRLAELTRKLKELDKQKDEFISVAAHELRSPLTAIKGYISMVVEGDAGDIPEKARGYLNDASSVNERLVRLVNNMLNVSRIEEGRLVFQLESTGLVKAVQEVYYSFRFEAERKGIEFKLDIEDGIKDEVLVDPDRVREVFGNLVSNAVKFTEKGSVVLKLFNPSNSKIRFEVIDTGPGITKEEQKKLFKKFFRASTTQSKTIGTGLGLYITKLLVEKFGGKIGLDSEFGKGSTFWVELPLEKQDASN